MKADALLIIEGLIAGITLVWIVTHASAVNSISSGAVDATVGSFRELIGGKRA